MTKFNIYIWFYFILWLFREIRCWVDTLLNILGLF